MKTLTAKSAKKRSEEPLARREEHRACRKETGTLKEEARAFIGIKSYHEILSRFFPLDDFGRLIEFIDPAGSKVTTDYDIWGNTCNLGVRSLILNRRRRERGICR